MTLPEIPDEAKREAALLMERADVNAREVLTVAWPHLYAAALRHAADRLDYPNPLDGDAVEWLREWADGASPRSQEVER